MNELMELLLQKAEELDWRANLSKNGKDIEVEFGKYSDAGEDFFFAACADTPEGIAEGVQSYYEDFDPEEHAAGCYGMKGAPGLRALLDDAESIDDMLRDLAVSLGDVVETWYEEHGEEDEEDA